jgi:hypothetical protein
MKNIYVAQHLFLFFPLGLPFQSIQTIMQRQVAATNIKKEKH